MIKKDVERQLGRETGFWFGFNEKNELAISDKENDFKNNLMSANLFENISDEDYYDAIVEISNLIEIQDKNFKMNSINFKILGIPLSKQSARFKNVKMGNKTFIKSYQKQEVIDNERNIGFDVKSQLSPSFIPFDIPIGVEVLFVFPPLSSWSKKKKALLESGEVIYKETKPDLTDNLMKGLFDALNGIVFTDDARVCKVESKKIYGLVPRIELKVYEL